MTANTRRSTGSERHVVCVLDLDSPSPRAVRTAAAFARAHQASLRLVIARAHWTARYVVEAFATPDECALDARRSRAAYIGVTSAPSDVAVTVVQARGTMLSALRAEIATGTCVGVVVGAAMPKRGLLRVLLRRRLRSLERNGRPVIDLAEARPGGGARVLADMS